MGATSVNRVVTTCELTARPGENIQGEAISTWDRASGIQGEEEPEEAGLDPRGQTRDGREARFRAAESAL